MKCRECNENLFSLNNCYATTDMFFESPDGHNHDDNCKSRVFECKNGHNITLSKRNTCPICDWKGKKTCFCHDDEKVDEWPEA